MLFKILSLKTLSVLKSYLKRCTLNFYIWKIPHSILPPAFLYFSRLQNVSENLCDSSGDQERTKDNQQGYHDPLPADL